MEREKPEKLQKQKTRPKRAHENRVDNNFFDFKDLGLLYRINLIFLPQANRYVSFPKIHGWINRSFYKCI
jgi:hypothetical protein